MQENTSTSLIPTPDTGTVALNNALRLWSETVTAPSTERRDELLGYKRKVVGSFFAFVGKSLSEVSPLDVESWRNYLSLAKPAGMGLGSSTVYVRVSFLSSFFEWAMRDSTLKAFIPANPAKLALPKAPKAYQTESVKAWTDEELQALVDVVRKKAVCGDIVGKRDYALLLFYLATGMRRQEVIGLRGRNLKLDEDSITITGKVKGGDYIDREVRDPLLRQSVLDYLSSSGRLGALRTDSPLWTRHDRAGRPGAALTSHAFVKNLKRYAREAGVGDVHLHQTRHSFARIVAEETGSLTETQDALGHRNASTTRVYVQRIAVKRDKHSRLITSRLNIGDEPRQKEG
jgi:integrase